MNDVIRYTATTASDNVEDMFDADNFYPYDGLGDVYDEDEYGYFSGLDADGEGLDIEYSEAFGDFVKKIGGAFKKGGLKNLVKNRREGLDDRLSAREDRIRGRQDRKSRRKTARGVRKNLRQMQTWKTLPPTTQQQAENIVDKSAVEGNPKPKNDLEQFKGGEADPNTEQKAMEIIQAANNDVATGNVGMESATFIGTDGNLKVGWWSKQGTGVKVAIIGGGIIALGLGIWGLTKIRK